MSSTYLHRDGAAAADGAGEADGAAAAVAKKEVQFTKGCILAVSGLTDGTTRENIKVRCFPSTRELVSIAFVVARAG